MKRHAVHLKPPCFIYAPDDRLPGQRGCIEDAYARDYRRLDSASRHRALNLEESLRLEECIRVLDRRAGWRAGKRQSRAR